MKLLKRSKPVKKKAKKGVIIRSAEGVRFAFTGTQLRRNK